MRIKNIVPEACHICGKQTSLAAIEPHPTDPEMQLDTFRCEDCGWLGADIPPGVVEDLERESAISRKPAEWGWSPRGTLWYALPITRTVLTAGSVPVTQSIADIADGEWKAYLDGRELAGSVKCSNRFLWGLRRPFVNAGAEPSDVAIWNSICPNGLSLLV